MPFAKGHSVSEETRAKIGNAHRGKIVSEKSRERMRLSHLGKKPSALSIEKLRQRLIGGHLSEETKRKIASAHLKNEPKISKGYAYIYCPQHPHATTNKYVLEHRLVMEKKLGRFLDPEEQVHHRNGNTLDNRIENLELFATNSDHWKFHLSKREKQFSPEQVQEIRKLRGQGMLLKKLANLFNTHYTVIGKICLRKMYREVA